MSVQGSVLSEETTQFYQAGVRALTDAGVPFLVGGAYALGRCTGIERHTKDFDVFVRPDDLKRALKALKAAGMRTEIAFPHWLAKAHADTGDFIDIIFCSGNGIVVVDDEWFDNAVSGKVLDMEVLFCPPEEIIWSKAFILERERYDGADVAHLLRECAENINWERLLRRFGDHWRVLLSHLILFGFIYPGEASRIPRHVMEGLLNRAHSEKDAPSAAPRVCRGTLLSREQYLTDINEWGYADARLGPDVRMNSRDIERWTRAIEIDGSARTTMNHTNGSGKHA